MPANITQLCRPMANIHLAIDHHYPQAARPVTAGIVALLVLSMATSAASEPLFAADEADQLAPSEVKRLPHKYDPVAAHLDALKIGTITSSLAYVDEQVAIFSAEGGKEPRQIATGRRLVLPLYVMSFGMEPASVTSYECSDRAGSLYCTFMLKKSNQRPSFAFEFWVDGEQVGKILKWYH